MAVGVSNTPFMDVVVSSGTPNTPQSLQALIQALPAARQPQQLNNPSGIIRSCSVQIQLDPAAGGAKGYIGSASTMTATAQAGVALVASQAWTPPNLGFNMYRFDQIFLMSDTASTKWYINYVTR